jgi:hypothetical protein
VENGTILGTKYMDFFTQWLFAGAKKQRQEPILILILQA